MKTIAIYVRVSANGGGRMFAPNCPTWNSGPPHKTSPSSGIVTDSRARQWIDPAGIDYSKP